MALDPQTGKRPSGQGRLGRRAAADRTSNTAAWRSGVVHPLRLARRRRHRGYRSPEQSARARPSPTFPALRARLAACQWLIRGRRNETGAGTRAPGRFAPAGEKIGRGGRHSSVLPACESDTAATAVKTPGNERWVTGHSLTIPTAPLRRPPGRYYPLLSLAPHDAARTQPRRIGSVTPTRWNAGRTQLQRRGGLCNCDTTQRWRGFTLLKYTDGSRTTAGIAMGYHHASEARRREVAGSILASVVRLVATGPRQ